jgi:LCP family protein required for cell wall assembly
MRKESDNNWEYKNMDKEFEKNIEKAFLMEEEEAVKILDEGEGKILDIEEQGRDGIEEFSKALHKKYAETLDKDSEDDIVMVITNSLAKQAEDGIVDEKLPIEEPKLEPKKKKKLWIRILIPSISAFMTLIFLFLFIRYTTPGQNLAIKIGAWFAAGRTNYEDGSNQKVVNVPDEIEDEDVIKNMNELKGDDVVLNADEGTARHEDYAVNILLLGEEAIDSGTARGRTDVMVIVTLNSKEKTIKLTSLMRDLYVQIPGHLDNKLNSAYATGGIPLLYETIELNLDLKLDGYALVDFNDFEKIIDLLDGVDISLTKTEANYLNSTNYISNPNFRNVVSGANHMNGNQALGYCRIRSVSTAEQVNNDFGRTSRHRIVIDAIFNKYKTLGLWDLAMVANSCLPMITTDLDASEIEEYLQLALEIGLDELEQSRIPVDGSFEDATIRKMSVIVPNLQKNVTALHEFVFGVTK